MARQPLLGAARRSGQATFPRAREEEEERKEKERERNAGQAGSHPDFFVVTESESENPPGSAPPPFQKNGASDATRCSRKSQKTKSIRLPCKLPNLDECVAFALSRKISESDARQQLEEWELSGGYDGLGNPILNWKQKLVAFRNSANLPSDKRAKRNGSERESYKPRKKTVCDI